MVQTRTTLYGSDEHRIAVFVCPGCRKNFESARSLSGHSKSRLSTRHCKSIQYQRSRDLEKTCRRVVVPKRATDLNDIEADEKARSKRRKVSQDRFIGMSHAIAEELEGKAREGRKREHGRAESVNEELQAVAGAEKDDHATQTFSKETTVLNPSGDGQRRDIAAKFVNGKLSVSLASTSSNMPKSGINHKSPKTKLTIRVNPPSPSQVLQRARNELKQSALARRKRHPIPEPGEPARPSRTWRFDNQRRPHAHFDRAAVLRQRASTVYAKSRHGAEWEQMGRLGTRNIKKGYLPPRKQPGKPRIR